MGSRFAPQSASIGLALGFFLISGMVSAGCVNRTGEELLPGLMSFPIAIELAPDLDEDGLPKYLYVTSSNFALQYNTGNLQAYDLERLIDGIMTGCVNRWVSRLCLDLGLDPALPECECDPMTEVNCVPIPVGIDVSCLDEEFEGDISSPECECDPDPSDDTCTVVPPDRCTVVPEGLRFRDPENAALKIIPVEDLLSGEVEIGSFSDGLDVSTDGRRIYVPVRSDANITWVDVNEEGQLDCGGGFGTRHACVGKYRSGAGELVNPTVNISFPPDPVDVYVGDLSDDFAPPGQEDNPVYNGDYILVAHREGRASLLIDQVPQSEEDTRTEKRPRLAATIDELAPEQVTITYEPGAKRAWMPSALERAIVRVGIGIDGDPTQSYLFNAGFLFVSGLDRGTSQRDIKFDPRPDKNLAYIVSRSPEALVVARSDVAGGDLNMLGQISTCRDPSRVQIAEVPARGGTSLLAFVSCFLSRRVNVIDTDKFQGITTLTNISGAFEFVIDGPRLLMYTADFSTSVLRVADLRPLVACLEGGSTAPEECSPQLLGLVGFPQPVSELPR
jgi:hypothetical protein